MKNIDILARGPKRRDRGDLDLSDISFDQHADGIWYVRKSPRPVMGSQEADEQARLVEWLRAWGRPLGLRWHSIPNDGAESPERMAHLKRTGLVPGVNDMHLMHPRGNLALEMKRANGRDSDVKAHQLAWLQDMVPLPSWTACVCFGYEAARAAVQRFLTNPE